MISLETEKLSMTCAACVFIGVGLLGISIILFACVLLNIVELKSFAVSGHSGLRTLASVGIAGCLLCAIGYHDD